MELGEDDFDDHGSWASLRDAARLLRVPDVAAVLELVQRGELPAFRIGGAIRIRRADLDAYSTSRGRR